MRICDMCFCEFNEDGSYEIKDGIQKDTCNKCLDRLESNGTNKDDETLVKEYIAFIKEKEENIENLILKLKSKFPNKYNEILRIDEADICCKS